MQRDSEISMGMRFLSFVVLIYLIYSQVNGWPNIDFWSDNDSRTSSCLGYIYLSNSIFRVLTHLEFSLKGRNGLSKENRLPQTAPTVIHPSWNSNICWEPLCLYLLSGDIRTLLLIAAAKTGEQLRLDETEVSRKRRCAEKWKGIPMFTPEIVARSGSDFSPSETQPRTVPLGDILICCQGTWGRTNPAHYSLPNQSCSCQLYLPKWKKGQ